MKTYSSGKHYILNLNKLSVQQVILLNQVAIEIQPNFNSLTNDIYLKTNRSISWLFSSLLSRNPYQSDLFLSCTQLVFIKSYVERNPEIKKIIVSNKAVRNVLINYYSNINTDIGIYYDLDTSIKNLLGNNIRSIFYLIANLKFAIKLFISRDEKRKKEVITQQPIKLIDTIFLQNSLDSGKYLDRNYNNILSYISEHDKKNIYFTPTILGKFNRSNLKKIYEISVENILFRHDFLKIKDYCWGFNQLYLQKFRETKKFSFYDFDITPIIKINHKKYKYSPTTYRALLDYRFVKNLIDSSVKIDLLIDWNENQPIDKSLIKGFRDFSPNTYIKGYQGYICSPVYHFYTIPSRYEVEQGLIPDEINVVGIGLIDTVTKFFEDIKVDVAPAFRFTAVFKQLDRKKQDKHILLLTLPVGITESVEIISLVFRTINLISNLQFIVKIKPHPALNLELVKSILKSEWLNEFQIVGGDLFELLADVTVLIGNSSSALMESLVKGIPVAVIGSQNGITQNPIPDNIEPTIWNLIYTPEELKDTILQFISIYENEPNKFMEIAEKLKFSYFEPVNSKTVSKFLNLR